MATSRKKSIENFTDEDGNIVTIKRLGVTEYIKKKYDIDNEEWKRITNTGTIHGLAGREIDAFREYMYWRNRIMRERMRNEDFEEKLRDKKEKIKELREQVVKIINEKYGYLPGYIEEIMKKKSNLTEDEQRIKKIIKDETKKKSNQESSKKYSRKLYYKLKETNPMYLINKSKRAAEKKREKNLINLINSKMMDDDLIMQNMQNMNGAELVVDESVFDSPKHDMGNFYPTYDSDELDSLSDLDNIFEKGGRRRTRRRRRQHRHN